MSPTYQQTHLFETRIKTSHLRAGSMRTKEAVLEAVKRGLNDCGLSRDEVASELSRLVGDDVSLHTLNNCCSEGKTNRRFPLEWAKALAMITGHTEILDAALGPEFAALDETGQACLEYGEIILEDKLRSKRKRQLQERVIRERLTR